MAQTQGTLPLHPPTDQPTAWPFKISSPGIQSRHPMKRSPGRLHFGLAVLRLTTEKLMREQKRHPSTRLTNNASRVACVHRSQKWYGVGSRPRSLHGACTLSRASGSAGRVSHFLSTQNDCLNVCGAPRRAYHSTPVVKGNTLARSRRSSDPFSSSLVFVARMLGCPHYLSNISNQSKFLVCLDIHGNRPGQDAQSPAVPTLPDVL